MENKWTYDNNGTPAYTNGTIRLTTTTAVCRELNRLSRPVTDAEIDAMFPKSAGMYAFNASQELKREGAKALRDKREDKG